MCRAIESEQLANDPVCTTLSALTSRTGGLSVCFQVVEQPEIKLDVAEKKEALTLTSVFHNLIPKSDYRI